MATATSNLVTVSEFLSMPDPATGHYELHHGEVVSIPPPKMGHERIQERLRKLLERVARDWMVVRVEMAFQPTAEHEVWRADVGVVTKERENATPDDAYLQGAPDLVVEVLSSSNTVDEISDKMHICMEHGCPSFWVVDGKLKEVHVTEPGFVTRRYSLGEGISIFGEFVSINEIFD
jgi:Uma2 family endonuclease